MAEPKTTEATEEKPARTPRAGKQAQPDTPERAGINASIVGDLKGPRKDLDLPDDDPGINANVVS